MLTVWGLIEQCLLDPKCLECKSINHYWVEDGEDSWCNEIICNIVEAGSTQVIEYKVFTRDSSEARSPLTWSSQTAGEHKYPYYYMNRMLMSPHKYVLF